MTRTFSPFLFMNEKTEAAARAAKRRTPPMMRASDRALRPKIIPSYSLFSASGSVIGTVGSVIGSVASIFNKLFVTDF